MSYKKSEFNYVQQNSDYCLVYNTLYNSMVRLDKIEFDRFDQLEDFEDEFSNLLVENGLWVDAEVDERARYLL